MVKVLHKNYSIHLVQKKCIQLILQKKQTFVWSCIIIKRNSYLFVNGTEIHKLKSKDSETLAHLLCLGNISKDWPVHNMKKNGLNSYVYDFSVDYDAIPVEDILDILKYLMKKKYMI